MNKILRRGNRITEIPPLLGKRISWLRREYSDGKNEEEKETDEEELKKLRKGPTSQDKQQSLQEDSYFHKEQAEQLKRLKKKILEKKWKKDKESED